MGMGEVYHVFTRSIAGYRIFNDEFEYSRMCEALWYYQQEERVRGLCKFKRLVKGDSDENRVSIVEIIAYCLMPTHIHLVLEPLSENAISGFMQNVLNSYTRYFNIRHGRKGPLWEGRFKKVRVENDSQLLHLTRYIHLNPVTAGLISRPEDWKFSSYKQYLGRAVGGCCPEKFLDIEVETYKEFVQDRISYQKELAQIKDLIMEQAA